MCDSNQATFVTHQKLSHIWQEVHWNCTLFCHRVFKSRHYHHVVHKKWGSLPSRWVIKVIVRTNASYFLVCDGVVGVCGKGGWWWGYECVERVGGGGVMRMWVFQKISGFDTTKLHFTRHVCIAMTFKVQLWRNIAFFDSQKHENMWGNVWFQSRQIILCAQKNNSY